MTATSTSQSKRKTRFRVIKLQTTNPWVDFFAIILALLAGLAISALIIIASGKNFQEAFGSLLEGIYGNSKYFQQTLIRTVPLIFTGLATVVAFRGKIWNIGGEGQFLAGAMMTAWISTHFASLPQTILVPLIIVGAMLGGALWAGIAGFLRAKYNVNEIIVTVMLNYLIEFILSYLLQGPWQDKSSYYIQSIAFAEIFLLPYLFRHQAPSWFATGFDNGIPGISAALENAAWVRDPGDWRQSGLGRI